MGMNLEILRFVFECPSSLEFERYGHEGPSTVFEGLLPLESERSEHEGSSSLFEGLSAIELERYKHYRPSSFFEGLSTFEGDDLFQIQSGLCFSLNTRQCN